MGWIMDIAAGTLRGAGRKDLADWITNAPAKLGEQIGSIINQGQDSGGTLTPDAIGKLEALSKIHPSKSPGHRPRDLEDEYATDLEALRLLTLAVPSSSDRRAIAVRGFLHDAKCTAIWVVDSRNASAIRAEPSFAGPQKNIYLAPAQVYLQDECTDEELIALNLRIERDVEAFIEEVKSGWTRRVSYVTKNNVTVEQRSTRRGRLNDNVDHPIADRTGIAEAFRTFKIATEAQAMRLCQYQRAKASDPNSPHSPTEE
jgi:hypothetical protein